VVSAVTYSKIRLGATGPKASPRHVQLVDEFCARLDAVLPWDRAAVDVTTEIKVAQRLAERRSGRTTVFQRYWSYSISVLRKGSIRIRVFSYVSFGGLMNSHFPSRKASDHIASGLENASGIRPCASILQLSQ
jgi:hypothetical protein